MEPGRNEHVKKIERAISIRQPCVEAIMDGLKAAKFRSRRTNIRERVHIHASLEPEHGDEFEYYGYDRDACPRGSIVGSVEIADCTGEDGYYQIHLTNPKQLKTFLRPSNPLQPMFWRPQYAQSAAGERYGQRY